MHVFSEYYPHIVSVDDKSSDVSFIIKYEDPPHSGRYHITTLGKYADGYANKIVAAEVQLRWIADGGEFPT
jgi:hypothetical protein